MMKRLFSLTLAVTWFCLSHFAYSQVEINRENFPDSLFMEYVKGFDQDSNGSLSDEECKLVTKIDVSSLQKLASLEGIGFFSSLQALNCIGTSLSEIDVSQNPLLSDLRCSNLRSLESLDLSNNPELKILWCNDNSKLSSIDLSENQKLEKLYCHYSSVEHLELGVKPSLTSLQCNDCDSLVSLSVEGPVLETLNCASSGGITVLDVSKCPELRYLYCEATSIKSLDVSKNPHLRTLSCFLASISSIDVSKNLELERLICSHNPISSLDVSKNKLLNRLQFDNTKIAQIDVSQNPELDLLDCARTGITNLDVSQNPKLDFLSCGYAPLEKLDLSRNSVLTVLRCEGLSLTQLNVTNNPYLKELSCQGSRFTYLDLSNNPSLDWLTCQNTPLTSLDLSKNENLSYFQGGGNIRVVKAEVGETFNLNRLPHFDLTRASGWTGGTVQDSILTFTDSIVTYKYATMYSGSRDNMPDTLTFKLQADPDLEEIFLPEALMAVVKGDEFFLKWKSQPDYTYELVLAGPVCDTMRDIETEGTEAEVSVVHAPSGKYYWAVRVSSIGGEERFSEYVIGNPFVVEDDAGLDELLISPVKLYPNPTAGSFFVEVAEPALMEIFNSTGLCLLRKEVGTGRESLQIGHSGLYLVRLTFSDGQSVVNRLLVR